MCAYIAHVCIWLLLVFLLDFIFYDDVLFSNTPLAERTVFDSESTLTEQKQLRHL